MLIRQTVLVERNVGQLHLPLLITSPALERWPVPAKSTLWCSYSPLGAHQLLQIYIIRLHVDVRYVRCETAESTEWLFNYHFLPIRHIRLGLTCIRILFLLEDSAFKYTPSYDEVKITSLSCLRNRSLNIKCQLKHHKQFIPVNTSHTVYLQTVSGKHYLPNSHYRVLRLIWVAVTSYVDLFCWDDI